MIRPLPVVNAIGENWLTGWSYRKSHVIQNSTGAGTNYQVQLIVKNASGSDAGNVLFIDNKTVADFRDLRVTDSDGLSLLYAWNETVFSGLNITIWTKIPEDLSTLNVTIYVYYGNPTASNYWDGFNTFLYFDDFNDGSFGNAWVYNWYNTVHTINLTESNGLLQVGRNGTGNSILFLSQNTTYAMPVVISGRFNSTNNLPTNDTKLYGVSEFSSTTDNAWAGSYNYPSYEADVQGNLATHNHAADSIYANTFYKWTLVLNSTGSYGYRDDVYKVQGLLAANIKTSGYLGLFFYFESLGTTQTSAVDWWYARKYVLALPADGSWGSEEQAGPMYDLTKTGVNDPLAFSTWLFYCFWFMNVTTNDLSGFIFCSNITGVDVNETWLPFPAANNTWSNTTKAISSPLASVITFQFLANDTGNNWRRLPLQYVIVQVAITFYWDGFGLIQRNGTSLANGTVTNYSAAWTLVLSALPETNCSYLNFTATSWTSTDNPVTFQVQTTITVWAYFGLGYGQGWIDGNTSGYSDGYTAGYSAGYSAGYFDGNASGWIDGNATGWAAGNATGYGVGYAAGYAQGYADGSAAGSFTYAIARFEFFPSNPENTTLILFNGSQSYYTDPISDYSWNFGDGNTTSSGAQDWIGHVYGTDGSYDVSLTVTASVSNSSAVVFHQVNVTSIVGGGGLSRTMPEDLATWVIAAFIGVMLLIAVVLIVRRRH
jgi:hypothetical protein